MINAGVSGDTTSGGRDRLDWSIPEGTEAVILELGANDACAGSIPPSPAPR
jgi:acyl-CoA thioesterase-1